MNILDYFQFDFIVRGFWVGLIIAVLGAVVGHFLVLKKVAMIGHGLSHAAYLSVAIAIVFLGQSLIFNLVFASIVAMLIQGIVKRYPSYSDVVIGVISATSVAIGTIIITTNPNQNVTVEQFLFGSMLLLRDIDVWAVIILSVMIVTFISFFYEDLATMTFDEDFARVIGIPVVWLNRALTLITAWLIILGLRSVGALLISSFIMFPTLIASPLSKRFKGTFFVGIGLAVLIFTVGFMISLALDWPTGSTMIVLYAGVWALTMLIQRLKKEF